jgi:2-polyprenyl-3-methyl-5-hydroxy-6-metoxy-1,4-benzoquinol methylase
MRVNETLTDDEVRAEIATVQNWYHSIEIRPGIVTPGTMGNEVAVVLHHLHLPEDCRGLRVLDLGTRDGLFAFEIERRGGEVLAVDYMAAELTGFPVAARLLGSRVPFLNANIYQLRPEDIGTFDIVLALGLLYHLPDPLGALRIMRKLCRSRLLLETLVIDHMAYLHPFDWLRSIPLMQFLPGSSFGNDPTNFWAPNIAGVKAMLRETEFGSWRVVMIRSRAIFDCDVTSDPEQARILSESSERTVR